MRHVLSFCLDKPLSIKSWKARFTFRILDPNVVIEDSWPRLSTSLPLLGSPALRWVSGYTRGHSPEYPNTDCVLKIAVPWPSPGLRALHYQPQSLPLGGHTQGRLVLGMCSELLGEGIRGSREYGLERRSKTEDRLIPLTSRIPLLVGRGLSRRERESSTLQVREP